MRKIIWASAFLDEPHKKLLLNRIAAVEAQAVDKRGLLDVIRAGVSDVGETLEKFGRDIEPLSKRINEVFQIARRSSPDYNQIPPPEELGKLPSPEEFDDREAEGN